MPEQNKSAPPQNARQPDIGGGGSALAALSTKEVKSLYHRSQSVRALLLFWVFAISLSVAVIAISPSNTSSSVPIYSVFVVLAVLAAFGIWRYKPWARVLNMVLCVALLPAFPIGTGVGLAGLVALWGSKRLFGPDRLLQNELKAELERRRSRDIV